MSPYKFHINKPDPSDEQVKKHKDFKKLLYNYQRATKPLYKTPLYKNRKVFLALLLILLLAYIVSEYTDKEKKDKKETEQVNEK